MRVAVASLAVLFAALASLNALGVFDPVDAWAVHHAMPGLVPAASAEPTLAEAVTPFGPTGGAFERAADVWLYPGSVPLSALLVGVCCVVLARRGRRRAAVLWGAALVAAVAVEVLVKEVVRRPGLHADGLHVVAFDSSLPSGHALRATMLAAAALYVSRRAGAVAAAWAATVLPLLVLAGWHTPSDVVAGAVLALTAVAAVHVRLDPRPA